MKLLTSFFATFFLACKKQPLLTLLFLVTTLFTFFYSFTQVDLSLTLSRSSVYQSIEKGFQYIGYFNRPLSTGLFIVMLLLLSLTYLFLIKKVMTKELSRGMVWTYLILMTGILIFSYNAFSYDLFNYIFDAKILTHYHLNPYLHKALDFPGDPMLSFMHWTHRNYPYGPTWLLLSLPFSLLGLNYFLPTFFLFKIGIAASFLGTLYFIEKVMKKVDPERSLLSLILIGFHPLLIVENLVSAHNDSVMMFFVFLSLYLLLINKKVFSFLSYFCSIGIKFATVFLVPSLLFFFWTEKKKTTKRYDLFFLFSGICMLLAVLVASHQSNFQPWYLTWALPFFLLLPLGSFGKAAQVVGAFSAASLLAYVPFLYFGDWIYEIPTNFFMVLFSVILMIYLVIGLNTYRKGRG